MSSISTQIDPDDPIWGSKENFTGIFPCGFKILVEIPESFERTKYAGVLEIPDSVESRYQQASVVARVLQLGPDCYRDKNKFPTGPWCKPGDLVAMSPYTGTRIRSTVCDKTLRFINDDSIDGTVVDYTVVERG